MFVDLDHPDPETVRRAAQVILQGGVVLSPTDTVYGLACDPFRPPALNRLCQVKGRRPDKGFLVLVENIAQVSLLASRLPANFTDFADRIWPGPVTLLLHAAENVPKLVRGGGAKVGCRLPASPFLQNWLADLGGPIVSTSANLSGQDLPATLAELRKLFEGRVDLFLQSGEPRPYPPSSVADLTTTPPRIVRKGAGFESLERALRKLSS